MNSCHPSSVSPAKFNSQNKVIVVKNLIKKIISKFVTLCSLTKIGSFLISQTHSIAISYVREISHSGLRFKFPAPNSICNWRLETFSTKEPETLEWIDTLPYGCILWDIGANIGIYSVYAAKKRMCRVWAFEPSVFNVELLARSIYSNGLAEQVTIVPLPLSDKIGESTMRMTSTEWGGALSTFDKKFGWNGENIKSVFEYKIVGISMDEAIKILSIPQPDFIKMDVDGLEHFILKGGASVLINIKGILIEVNDDFIEQAIQSKKLLTDSGLVMKKKCHSKEINDSESGFQNTYNQIWIRN